ncbi:MAG TPA: sigma-70 family RNA polymerase sigma factor [Chloroflexota bacterium]|jgi:RNA polymerase sigma factor (sigma-70 family)|nr:sigma-70 family RNA polymerase sigma factor [Chloroflexota bacterium]
MTRREVPHARQSADYPGRRGSPAARSVDALIALARSPETPLPERQEAFGELVQRYQDLAYGYAYALLGDYHLAQDAAQEAFLTAYGSLGQLRVAQAFPGWLRCIVRTHCVRFKRRALPDTGMATASEMDWHVPLAQGMLALPASDGDPLAAAEAGEVRETLAVAIRGLPDHERTATVLFYLSGYTQLDIARFLDVPPNTVKKRLQSARRRMQERILAMEGTADTPGGVDGVARAAAEALPGAADDQRWQRRSLPGMLATVGGNLRAQAPSRDGRFLDAVQQAVQLQVALEAAAAESELHLMEQLLVDGVDVDAPDEEGKTLLTWAAQRGHADAATFLLAQGADVNARDRAGKTPLRWAMEGKHRQLAQLLRRHGGTL